MLDYRVDPATEIIPGVRQKTVGVRYSESFPARTHLKREDKKMIEYVVWFPGCYNSAATEVIPITHRGQIIDARGRRGWIMRDGHVHLHQGVSEKITVMDVGENLSYVIGGLKQ